MNNISKKEMENHWSAKPIKYTNPFLRKIKETGLLNKIFVNDQAIEAFSNISDTKIYKYLINKRCILKMQLKQYSIFKGE